MTTGATICATRTSAGHDGSAELIVMLRHPNGGCSEVTLDWLAADALMQACNARNASELDGHGWEKVRDALAVSWNRYRPSSDAVAERPDPEPDQGTLTCST